MEMKEINQKNVRTSRQYSDAQKLRNEIINKGKYIKAKKQPFM